MQKLAAVEQEHGVRVLYACESGSRGWGFASPDSDYDVRFIYVRPVRDYLRVFDSRDVIEEAPGPIFDVNGWDVRKALRLLSKGNATLVEWLSSPVVYAEDKIFTGKLRAAMLQVYQPHRGFHHYLHMARGNYREYLQGDVVRVKKYLYVLRPILAAQWTLAKSGMPPMSFEVLVDAMVHDPLLREDINDLLREKRQVMESAPVQRRPRLNMFIEESLAQLALATPPMVKHDMSVLDDLLADTATGFS